MIHFSNVTKFYERQAAIKNVTFSIEKGEMVFYDRAERRREIHAP